MDAHHAIAPLPYCRTHVVREKSSGGEQVWPRMEYSIPCRYHPCRLGPCPDLGAPISQLASSAALPHHFAVLASVSSWCGRCRHIATGSKVEIAPDDDASRSVIVWSSVVITESTGDGYRWAIGNTLPDSMLRRHPVHQPRTICLRPTGITEE